MAYTPEFRAEIEGKLSQVVPIRSRAMFGGVAFYSDEMLFAMIDDGKLYFKVTDSNRADYEAAGMEPFVPYEGAKPMGYYELPPGLIDRPNDLKPWAEKSLAAAAEKKAKKR